MAENPNLIADALVDVFEHVCIRLTKKGLPWTSEDARAIAISACIEAAKNGWNPYSALPKQDDPSPVPSPAATEHPDKGTAPSDPHPGNGKAPPQETQPKSESDYRAMTQAVGMSWIRLTLNLIDDVAMVLGKNGTGSIEAAKPIRADLVDAYQKEWQKPLNINALKTHTEGQVRWCIAYLKAKYAAEIAQGGK